MGPDSRSIPPYERPFQVCRLVYKAGPIFPLIPIFAVYILLRNIDDELITSRTPAPFGASISINVVNFALICKDRTAISVSLC